MICPHCQSKNADDALRCARCGITFSVIDDGETLGPGSPTAAARAAVTPRPGAPSSALSPPPGSGSASGGSWGSAAGGTVVLEPGMEFGARYRIESLLGEGGMGAVYKAYDRELDRVVALKLLRPGMVADATALQRFKQELLLASKISHKNILRIHDLGDAAGVKFISMAFVEGDDLHGILKKAGRLPVDRTVALARQLCGALEAAHAEGVVHRDLKPQNVLVDTAGNPYISDFGLAKSLDTSLAGMTRAGELLGTPRYMSPEQVQGGKIDHRSDLYSFGLMLYEMLTGDLPFASDSTLGLMYQRVKQKPKSPRQLNLEIPAWLDRVVLRCLEKEPDKRYQSAREILLDLEAAGSTSVVSRSASGSRTIQIILPVERGRKLLLVGGSVLALLIVLALAIPQTRRLVTFPFRKAETRVGPRETVTMLVADFNNATGDPLFDGTLESALGIALEGASFVNSYNRAEARKRGAQLQPGATSLTEPVARLVAVREGISVVILGTIRKRGEGYQLRVEAVDGVTGASIATEEADVPNKDGVLTALSKLAIKMRQALGDSTPESVQMAAAETFSTQSLEAAQQYARAQELQWAGKWDEALQQYQKALATDPELGRAYAGMAAVYSNMGRLTESEKHYQLALSKIDRMSDREKYRTRSGYYLLTRNPDKAIEELTELVRRFPSDTAGVANLALAHFYRREMVLAVEGGQRAVELSPRNVPQRNNLGLYAMYAGDFETAIREQRRVVEMNPQFVTAYVGIALSQLAQGQATEAAETYRQMGTLSEWGASMSALGLADIALYEGRAADAMQILEVSLAEDLRKKDGDNAAHKLIALAEAYLLSGKTAQAAGGADRALAAAPKDNIRYEAARIFLASGKESKARALATELEKRVEQDPQAYAKLIAAEDLLRRHKAQEAIKLILEARKLADTWMGRFLLGRAYLEAGAYAEAYSEFEVAMKRRGEATAAFLDEVPTFRLWPAVYYYMGRAQEGLKSPASTESFQTFLAMKKDGSADPLVADARRRVAAK